MKYFHRRSGHGKEPDRLDPLEWLRVVVAVGFGAVVLLTMFQPSPAVSSPSTRPPRARPNRLSGAVGLAVRGGHACALLDTGSILCWGMNSDGELGDGTTTERNRAVEVVGLEGEAAAVSLGVNHTCALMAGGGVKCWGANFTGQLGDGTTSGRTYPAEVVGLETPVQALSAGWHHACVLNAAGGVQCWGDYGQFGGTTPSKPTRPALAAGLESGVTALGAGSEYSCAVLEYGQVACWGILRTYDNSAKGTTEYRRQVSRPIPAAVYGLEDGVAALSAGSTSTCVITSSGGVQCWGDNEYFGQLGDGTRLNQTYPVDVVGLDKGVKMVAVGTHTCVVTEAGGVKCWGKNWNGQVGDGTQIDRFTPVDVVGLDHGVTAVGVGDEFTCALLDTGGVKCWGLNIWGRLGDGTEAEMRAMPVDVLVSTGID